jgi:hypothetical protein
MADRNIPRAMRVNVRGDQARFCLISAVAEIPGVSPALTAPLYRLGGCWASEDSAYGKSVF